MLKKYSFLSADLQFYNQDRNYIKKSYLRKDNLTATEQKKKSLCFGWHSPKFRPMPQQRGDNWNLRRGSGASVGHVSVSLVPLTSLRVSWSSSVTAKRNKRQ